MKTKKSKLKKLLAAIAAFLLIGFILITVNGFVGNPLSKILVNRAAQKRVEEKYRDLDLEVDKAVYDFKTGRYIVNIESEKSIDTHFELGYSGIGKLEYDFYKSSVLEKWNTFTRINYEYSDLVDKQIEKKLRFKERDFMYGELRYEQDEIKLLEQDKIYDIKEVAKSKGHIIVHMEREQRDAQIIAKELLKIKKIFDDQELPFYQIDIDLSQPRDDHDIKENDHEEGYLMIENFPYKDIYVDGLEKRVEENIKKTKKYYEEQDKETQKEIEQFEKDKQEKDKK